MYRLDTMHSVTDKSMDRRTDRQTDDSMMPTTDPTPTTMQYDQLKLVDNVAYR